MSGQRIDYGIGIGSGSNGFLQMSEGGILLSVHSDSSEETKRAKEILERTGAQDISSTGEAKAERHEKELFEREKAERERAERERAEREKPVPRPATTAEEYSEQ